MDGTGPRRHEEMLQSFWRAPPTAVVINLTVDGLNPP
jgi:hypothetical protein